MGLVDLKEIFDNRDAAALQALDDDDMLDFLLHLWCNYFHRMPLSKFNETQKMIFLCMELENTCQADGILNLTEEEEIFFAMPRMVQAHYEMDAPKTAALLQEFMDLLPEGTFENRIMPQWKWFWEDEDRQMQIQRIDSDISDYPDGTMWGKYCDLIRSNREVARRMFEI